MISDNLNSHRSIRKYKDKKVSMDLIKEIFSHAINTSSSGNMQPYSIIVTTNKEIKNKIYHTLDEQLFIEEAPCFITFCADFNRMRKWIKLNNAPMNFDNFLNFMIGNFDATLMSQSASLIAEEKGLGICYVGSVFYRCYQLSKILNLPKYVTPVVGYTLGYPDEQPPKRDRLPIDGLMHHDTYQDYNDDDIKNIYKEREEKGWKRYMDTNELREKIKKNNINNLAEVYTKIKYKKKDHDEASVKIIKYLKDQFFGDF